MENTTLTVYEVSIDIISLHCVLTTSLTVLGVVVDKVFGLLMLQSGYVTRHGIRGLTLKGQIVAR